MGAKRHESRRSLRVNLCRAVFAWRRPRRGRPRKRDLSTWTVTDDWPENVPVTDEEVAVFERWFGALFDELFDPQPTSEQALEAPEGPRTVTARDVKRYFREKGETVLITENGLAVAELRPAPATLPKDPFALLNR